MKTRIALATLIGAAMIACTQNTPESVKTSVLEPVGFGNITFIDDSQGKPALNLTSKALTGYDGGFVQVKRISVNSFTVGARPPALNGYRYVSFTYAVRNATGAGVPSSVNRSNLTFIPVSISSGSGTTLNAPLTTAVSGLGRFDGTAASSTIAQEVQPTHGSRFNPLTGKAKVNDEQADMQVFTESEISNLSLSSSGWPSTHTAFPYGFVVRSKYNTENRTLRANPGVDQFDGLVTFGFKVPLQADVTQDPFVYSVQFVVAQDNAARVTRSNEEESYGRTNDQTYFLGGTAVLSADVCNVRYAGVAGSPASKYLTGFGSGNFSGVTGTPIRDSCFNPFGTIPGQTTLSFGVQNQPTALAVQPDGKYLVAGSTWSNVPIATYIDTYDFALARFNANGTLDSGFGTGGKVTIDFSSGYDECHAMVLQPDGKILLAGNASPPVGGPIRAFGVVRLNSNGTLDSSFGTGGKTLIDFGSTYSFAFAMALQSDGKVVLVGGADAISTTGSQFAMTRLNSNGTLDTGFGTSGKVSFFLDQYTRILDRGYAVAIHNSKIIVAVEHYNNLPQNGLYDFAVLQFNMNGMLDSDFDGQNGNGDGKLIFDFDYGGSNADHPASMLIDVNGRIVIGGYSQANGAGYLQRFALLKLKSDGTKDPDFYSNVSGPNASLQRGESVYLSPGDGLFSRTNQIAVRPNYRYLIAGTAAGVANNSGKKRFILLEATSYEGRAPYYQYPMDTLLTGFANRDNELSAVVSLPNGQLLLAGLSRTGSQATSASEIVIARIHPYY
jgi:uncharacterized delta-60 repeat protein